MKFAVKTLVLAATLTASLAHADTVTLNSDSSVSDNGWQFSNLTGSGTLSFSPILVAVVNIPGATVTGVDPATLNAPYGPIGSGSRLGYSSIAAGAPITSVTGSFDGSNLAISSVATSGGAMISAQADGFSTNGGWISITNLRVDLTGMQVYADISGANGVGTVTNVDMWSIGQWSGPTSVVAASGTTTINNTLSQLSIQPGALSLFDQSMGLTTVGVAALSGVTDYGSITSVITLNATPVPEASSGAALGLGLGLAAIGARRRRKSQLN